MLLDERLELSDYVTVPAGLEVGFDPFLERRDPLLLERSHRSRGESLELEIGKGGAAPDLERGPEP